MVAISGAIMPEPLAMPVRVTCSLPNLAVAVASLGNVSVVIMARAAACQSAAPSACCTAFSTGAVSSTSPITPVEATSTSWGLQPICSAVACAVTNAALAPAWPVKALALPALTKRARALPFAARKLARDKSTAAEGILDWVKTPATVLPAGKATSNTSSRP